MKKWLPWIIVGVFALWIVGSLRPPRQKSEFDVHGFARLPVLLNGRIQPFDSVAINALLSMRGKRTVGKEERSSSGQRTEKISASEWLLNAMMRPEEADKYKSFRVQHPDVQGLLGRHEDGLGYFSFADIEPYLDKIDEQTRPIREALSKRQKDSKQLTPYERDLMHLYDSLILYKRLKNTLRPEHEFPYPELFQGKPAGDFFAELEIYPTLLKAGLEEFRKQQAGEKYAEAPVRLTAQLFERYNTMAVFSYPLTLPPPGADHGRDAWSNVGTNLLQMIHGGEMHPVVKQFAKMTTAFRYSKPAEFNQAVAEYRQWLVERGFVPELNKGRREFFFNQFEPFYKTTVIYVAALLVGCAFWLNWTEWVRKTSVLLLLLAFIVHTVGLGFRMFLEGRPPVTNLYSSAIFIGWGAVVLGLTLERFFRLGIGVVVASTVGFVTLIIAHHLSLSGDTMQMLQAVLDTNFWLATHVVVITAGYSAMFMAGVLAIVFVVLGLFSRLLTRDISRALTRMVYGIICFATLFSFVGTILGGIWADQSWGRFWGWDPKENGALLIVIWCAIILHARWGGIIRERGLMATAIFGNVVTSFSWFGVNMLGVGLHSYGFMDKAFQWLILFVTSQVVLIAMAMIPERHWLSFRGTSNGRETGDTLADAPGLPKQRPAV